MECPNCKSEMRLRAIDIEPKICLYYFCPKCRINVTQYPLAEVSKLEMSRNE